MKWLTFLIALGILLGGLAAPGAWAQTYVYVDVAFDFPNMVATSVTDTNYAMGGQHTAYATVRLTSPSGRSTQVTGFQADVVTVITLLPVETEGGTWVATNDGKEYCPWSMIFYQRGTAYASQMPTPSMWIYHKWFDPGGDFKRTGDQKNLKLRVLKMTTCSAASAQVQAAGGATTPGLEIIFEPGAKNATFSGLSADQEWSVTTSSGNPTMGTLKFDLAIVNSGDCVVAGQNPQSIEAKVN